MLKSVAVRVFLALLIVGFGGQAVAGLPGETSHSAMGGSTLMETTAQFNSWTHWIVNHDDFVELSVGDEGYYGPDKLGSGRGQGTLHWQYSENSHLLFRVRQFDLGGQNSNFLWGGTLERPFLSPGFLFERVSGYSAYLEGQMVNLAWARNLSGGGAFSLGLLYSDAGYKAEDPDDEFNNKSSAFGAQVTWGNGDGFDLAASVFNESATWGDTDAEDESSMMNFDLTARFARDNGWIYQLGFLMGSGSWQEFEDEEWDLGLMGVTANAGRFLVDNDMTDVTAEFFVHYLSYKEEVGDFEDEMKATVVPGTRVACRTQLGKRFELMAGANAIWSQMKGTETFEGDEASESERGMDFYYSGGLAFTPSDNVRIEGQLHMDELNNLLSLGNENQLLIRVGGTVVF
ncbi:MAG: hypothetical protein IH621_04695 [Krumholzibacteria bacterium]|nr:hypothetical protein [Candidatus Krumholzibacteria bacterium]